MKSLHFLRTSPLRYRAGFTAVEALVAVFIVSMVGLLIGRTLLMTGRSATRTNQARRATELAEMVMEQYTAYAARGLGDLTSYDTVNTTYKIFFGTKDNSRYKGLRITSLTKENESGADIVTVTISWGTGAQAGCLVFDKSFAQTSGQDPSVDLSGV